LFYIVLDVPEASPEFIETYSGRFFFTLFASIFIAFVYRFVALRAIDGGSELSKWLKKLGSIYRNIRGTKFCNADLTGATFRGAELGETDFRLANTTSTCWLEAKEILGRQVVRGHEVSIERIRSEGTILADLDVRELLVTGSAKSKDFCGKNLKGAYLAEADLSEYDFAEADISNANLEGANLEGANFTKVQASGTSFAKSKMSKASGLGLWNIDSNTNLNNVDCCYIYLKDSGQERRPSDINTNFEPGDLKRLFQKALETVDLIFKEEEGIDFEALRLSLEKLRVEAEGIEVTIQAIEKKPDGSFLVRVRVPLEVNKAEVEKFLKREYELALKVIDDKYQLQLQLQGERVKEYRQEIQERRQENTDLRRVIEKMAENQGSKYDMRGSTFGSFVDTAQSGSQQLSIQSISMSQDLGEAVVQIQELLERLQKGGMTVDAAQQQVARDIAVQVQTDPTMKDKLLKWGQSLGDATVSDVVKGAVKLAIRSAGLPLP